MSVKEKEQAKRHFDEIYDHVHHQRFIPASEGLYYHVDKLIKFDLLSTLVRDKNTLLHLITIMGQLHRSVQ